MNLISLLKTNDAKARAMLEEIRWPNGPVCPHCAHDDRIHPITGKSARNGLYECGECSKQFTVTVGTVMHNSRLPLVKWIAAFYMICSDKKGVSAAQLQRDLNLGSYRTAWHMAHRIRAAMQEEPLSGLLSGAVVVDEAYVGGKPRPGEPKSKRTNKRGRGTNKTSALAMLECSGRARSGPVERFDAKTQKSAVINSVHAASVIFTDERNSYTGLGESFPNGHKTTKH
ncbi:IS1595 family transposase [Tateyamaria sp. syn59]|uniref:IS1595 family transposase n=1 Tax=Tateyamaria sp. syn59 TaxID=2576942 RepID=UPI0011BE1F72|nr:IS1595 family transposase [Tateyamaria sp. syn59]